MWPKMLIELLPHLTRLVPMWDRFLNSKAANDKATESALTTMAAAAEGVRGDLAQVTAAQASLYRQLQEQAARIEALSDDVRMARQAAERAASAAAAELAEPGIEALASWIKGGTVVIVLLLLVVIVLQLLHHDLHL